MSARRKHVRAHARDVEVDVDRENDHVCRVEEIKGRNVIEVRRHQLLLLLLLSLYVWSLLEWVTTFVVA